MEEESKPYLPLVQLTSLSDYLQTNSTQAEARDRTAASTPRVTRGRLKFYCTCPSLKSPKGTFQSRDKVSRPWLRCVAWSRYSGSRVGRVLASRPKSSSCVSACHFYLFKSGIPSTNRSRR